MMAPLWLFIIQPEAFKLPFGANPLPAELTSKDSILVDQKHADIPVLLADESRKHEMEEPKKEPVRLHHHLFTRPHPAEAAWLALRLAFRTLRLLPTS